MFSIRRCLPESKTIPPRLLAEGEEDKAPLLLLPSVFLRIFMALLCGFEQGVTAAEEYLLLNPPSLRLLFPSELHPSLSS